MSGRSSTYVLPIAGNDFGRAAVVLARAFHRTPQWSAVVPDPVVRTRKLREMFAGTLVLTTAARGVAERTEGMEGVALWLPPGRDIGFAAIARSGFASVRFMITPPFVDVRRLLRMLRQFDRVRRRLMPRSHWYLMALGVDPQFAGRGYGPLLVRAGTLRADADAVPTYLETEAGPNVRFYEKLGFEEVAELTIEAYGLPFRAMVRPPG